MKFRTRVFALALSLVVVGTYVTIIRPDDRHEFEGNDNDYIDVDVDRMWDSGPDLKWAVDLNSSGNTIPEHLLRRRRLSLDGRIQEFVKAYRLNWSHQLNITDPWAVAAKWVNSRQIVDDRAPELGTILKAMATHNVTSADVGYRGTQLKLTLVLDGKQTVVFKPKWYPRSYVVEGKPYEGHDRHNAEIVAFHLSRLVGLRRVPLTVGRIIDLEKDILPVASERLRNTFFTNGTNTCFYGKCLYCKSQENGVCANGTLMEGSVVLWLPKQYQFQQYRHPWGRTYKEGKKARWEYDSEHYCNDVRRTPLYSTGPLLMDIIETCVFDFIIGNGDRHHYEVFENDPNSMLIMFDNGKSFGNPKMDERTILAPLDQCKQIRADYLGRLRELTDGVLSRVIRQVTSEDPIAPLLAESHYVAMDRRLAIVLHSIDYFIRESSFDSVLITDGYS